MNSNGLMRRNDLSKVSSPSPLVSFNLRNAQTPSFLPIAVALGGQNKRGEGRSRPLFLERGLTCSTMSFLKSFVVLLFNRIPAM